MSSVINYNLFCFNNPSAAGIPDFRSPGTGLYDNLQKYNLPNPMAIFELGYFKVSDNDYAVIMTIYNTIVLFLVFQLTLF